jgi:hypothetical protein
LLVVRVRVKVRVRFRVRVRTWECGKVGEERVIGGHLEWGIQE